MSKKDKYGTSVSACLFFMEGFGNAFAAPSYFLFRKSVGQMELMA
ncbi:MAG: hypothetical protein AAF990_22640 [Bacteroidota bacterium]